MFQHKSQISSFLTCLLPQTMTLQYASYLGHIFLVQFFKFFFEFLITSCGFFFFFPLQKELVNLKKNKKQKILFLR